MERELKREAPKPKNEADIDRFIGLVTRDVKAGTLPKRYATLSAREKAETLYDFLLTLKLTGKKDAEDEEAQQILKSQIKALVEDKEAYALFRKSFTDARLESADLRKSDLYVESKNLEGEIGDLNGKYKQLERKLFTEKIKGAASRKLAKEELADLAIELVEKRLKREALIRLENIDHTKENTDLAANQNYETLARYYEEAKDGFAWMPSRLEIDKAIKAALANGRFPLLVGEPGTGKSEQANAAARELTGELCVKLACTDSTGEHDLLFDTKILPGGGTFLEYGAAPKAFTGYESSEDTEPQYDHGRVLRLDEFLKINFNKSFGHLKEIGQKKPGDEMNEKIKHPVLPGSTIIATTNPAGTRHELKRMPPALEREFAEIEVPYLPMSHRDPELYDFMTFSLMNDKKYIPIAKSELAPAYVRKEVTGQKTSDGREIAAIEEIVPETNNMAHGALYRLAFAVKTIQDCYVADNPDKRKNYEATLPRYDATNKKIGVNGEPLTLKSSTLTPKEIAAWMKGYHKRFELPNKEMHTKTLSEWLRYKAGLFINQSPEDDRPKVEAIFRHFGILDPKPLLPNEEPMTRLDIGYLSPRVPRPVGLKKTTAVPKAGEAEASLPETRVVEAKDYVTVANERINVFPKGFAFDLPGSSKHYEIAYGQALKVKGKEASFAGVDGDGNAVILIGALVRKITKADFEKLLKKESLTTYEKTLSLLGGENIISGDDITKAFGITVENIKPIPFNEAEIKLHKALGHKLVYEVNRTPEGEPLTLAKLSELAGNNIIATNTDGTPKEYRLYKDQFDDTGKIKDAAWFSKETAMLSETPGGEWKFVSAEVIPGTESKNYIDQTDFLIKYVKDNIFKKTGLPVEYQKTIEAWNRDKPKIQQLITDAKWPEAAKALGEHPISQLLRESFTSTVYRTITLQKSRNQKILSSMYSRSCSFSSDGILVYFGVFGAGGAHVSGRRPVAAWSSMGAVFSRMKPLEIEL
ncbi:MAG: AAA family ATPase [Candidatus Vogelbacteria bacterium]|nr:AAA family ATPase [Candidatus Vogelbacteria bacterium]